ncbi:unnamed protein product [Toxocara canis]|uniref:DUF295 domain-containing protein n=1 Tax=Toxocara canis TaxID=6265 RepID=A0A183UVN9_TOXCA|nr:unnamed protein product [Toxocara canis]
MPELELEDDCRFRPTTENYVTIISFCLIFCLSVVGNSVVVVVIVQRYVDLATNDALHNEYLLAEFGDLGPDAIGGVHATDTGQLGHLLLDVRRPSIYNFKGLPEATNMDGSEIYFIRCHYKAENVNRIASRRSLHPLPCLAESGLSVIQVFAEEQFLDFLLLDLPSGPNPDRITVHSMS